jgi:N-acetylneuraminic acid mutarotase
MANGAGAALNGKLYVVAGTRSPEDSTAVRGFWMLDLQRADAGWRELPVWPGPARIYPVVGVQEGALFLFSGLEISPAATGGVARRHLRDGYRFDPATEVWTRTADLPRPAAAAPTPLIPVAPSTLMIPGGDDGTIVDFKPLDKHPGFNRTMLAYHTGTNTWRTLGTLPASRVTTPTAQWREWWTIPSGEVSPGVRSPEVWALTAPGAR